MNSGPYASQRIRNVDAGLKAYGRISDKTSCDLIDTIRFDHEHGSISNVTVDPTPNDSFRVTATSLTKRGLQNFAYLARYCRQARPLSLFVRSMGSQDTEAGDVQYETASALY